VCRERLNIAGRMAEREAARHGEWPRELATLKGWVRGRWNTPEGVDRVFAACPSGGDWIYTTPNASPVAGEVLLRCTAHPENRWIWQQRDVEAYLARLKHPFRY